jgi:hypothetical protein
MAKVKTKEIEKVEEDLRRSFEFTLEDGPETFFLEMPTSEQIRQAEWHYSKVYNKALVEGVTTTSEMMDILTKRGLYGPDYEKKLQELQVAIALKIAEMHGADDETKEESAREVQTLRDELYRWNQRLTGPLSNTCEQMADDAKTEYLTSVVVQDEAGDSVWESYDDFISEKNQAFALKARFEVLLWLQGLESDFLEKTPENKVLRDLSIQKAEDEARMAEESAAPAQLEASEEKTASAKKAPAKKKTTKGRSRKSTAK